MSSPVDITYKASPTAVEFHNSAAYVRGLMGPVGSGKSVSCIMEMFKKSCEQAKAPDGKRYTRWLVVRNTYGELINTTMKTFDDWFPQEVFGKRSGTPPYRQVVQCNDVHMEVIWMALDDGSDVKKLMSFEPTGIFFNEARYIPFELIAPAIGRLGRYPSAKLGGATWSGIIMDTNPPDDQHWWYEMAENQMWLYDHKAKQMRDIDEIPPEKRWDFFQQPSGLSPEAENLENLLQTPDTMKLPLEQRRAVGRVYYERMCFGQTQEYINVYVHGQYGMVVEGKAVFGDYWNDDLHVVDGVTRIKGGKVYVGLDCSGRNPAAVFGQRTPDGGVLVLDEIVTEDTGAVEFAMLLGRFIEEHYKDHTVLLYGDPAGGWKSQNNEETYFDVIRSKTGHVVMPASEGLRFPPRREAVIGVLTRMVRGRPALQMDKSCKTLRKGMNGGYYYKKHSTSAGTSYSPEPEKKGNRCADVMDAAMYMLVGMGEVKSVRGRQRAHMQTVMADWNFSV